MKLNKQNAVFIIAEAGVNHNGNIQTAKQLIDVAVEAKADAVKFQTFIAENVISRFAEKAEYQKKTTGYEESQLEMVKKLQLSFPDFVELKMYCELRGIMFLSTPFDLQSVDFLKTLNLGIWKIPSGEITNLPYLKKIGSYQERIIISTGMCGLGDIENALQLLINSGTLKENITLLHCNTEYPTPMDDVNLNAIVTLKNSFDIEIGYSDHTVGIEVPIAAVSMGATVIEKHFTLDKNMVGPDHRASLEPNELISMVKAIRNIELAMGTGIKIPSSSEIKNRVIARRSIVAARTIVKGEFFSEENLIAKRPGSGISPMRWYEVIGEKAIRDFGQDEMISLKS